MTWYEEKYQWGVKALPKDPMGRKTTVAEWDKWLKETSDFYAWMDGREPNREAYETEVEYNSAMSEWNMARSMDRPNEPGYYRAAND